MGAEQWVPDRPTVERLREAAAGCKGCDLWSNATQTVFGEGSEHAKLMLVGEQPGDHEDVEGKPFVGPAGRLLDTALERAAIPRANVYLTNVVKHFKWVRRGKRRLHEKPNSKEVRACRPWLDAEVKTVQPRLVVLLGATAAQAVLGPTVRVTRQRGQVVNTPLGVQGLATVHPSSILRAPDDDSRREAMDAFVEDLRVAARYLS
ncbi:MAG: UdgX family uracil-DNA binding protein [Chloroflexi bacterium]|nr:MAG: UdgX family uracil-DNA binding protein [Chloroflexota bacterium]